MNGWILIQALPWISAKERAQRISRELFNVTLPERFQTHDYAQCNVFGVVEHPDGEQVALQIDTEHVIPVHPQATLEKLVTLFPEVPETERMQLHSYVLHASAFPFGAIIPSTSTVRDEEYMNANGWFPNDLEDV
jgi:hypothetical protein